MTNIELIRRALLAIGVINESETPSAEQGADALATLNEMLEMWEEEGVALGWAEQSDTGDDAPLPPYATRGVTLKLAIALAPDYGGAASITPALIKECDDAYGMILRKAALKNLKPNDTRNMPASEGGNGRGFNILTG